DQPDLALSRPFQAFPRSPEGHAHPTERPAPLPGNGELGKREGASALRAKASPDQDIADPPRVAPGNPRNVRADPDIEPTDAVGDAVRIAARVTIGARDARQGGPRRRNIGSELEQGVAVREWGAAAKDEGRREPPGGQNDEDEHERSARGVRRRPP